MFKKRALRFVLDDYESSYHDLLIQCEVSGIKIVTLRLLAIEVFKCVNKLNPEYLNEMFTIKKCPYDFRDTSILERSKSNTTKYGLKSFRNYGAKIWNLLPNICKSVISLGDFKNIIKSWKFQFRFRLQFRRYVSFIHNFKTLWRSEYPVRPFSGSISIS